MLYPKKIFARSDWDPALELLLLLDELLEPEEDEELPFSGK